jgi:hypothetical protein
MTLRAVFKTVFEPIGSIRVLLMVAAGHIPPWLEVFA